MKLGSKIFIILCFLLFFKNSHSVFSEEKIKSVPLINLENLSPTFEEDKDELEKMNEKNVSVDENSYISNEKKSTKNSKVYINITALDKITAKTSSISLAVGDKKFFGALEIIALKCEFTESKDSFDTVAYLQVKDLSAKNNNQVFIFNGWTFASSPSLKPFDHPVYDIWITKCFN